MTAILEYGLIDKPNGMWIVCACGRIDTIKDKPVEYRPTSEELWDHYLTLGWQGTPENCKCPDCVRRAA